MDDRNSSCLVADIGGTHTRFAWLQPGSPQLHEEHSFDNVDFGSLEAVIDAYLSRLETADAPKPGSLTLAVAAPVQHDRIRLINHDWQFSRSGLSQRLGVPVSIINDFSAQAYY